MEVIRLIEEGTPKYVVFENSPMLRQRGMGTIVMELQRLGYCVEWSTLSVEQFDGLHKRERVWLVAYPQSERMERLWSNRVEIVPALAGPFLSERLRYQLGKIEPCMAEFFMAFPEGHTDLNNSASASIRPLLHSSVTASITTPPERPSSL